jgi:protoporphyrinogen oxidase
VAAPGDAGGVSEAGVRIGIIGGGIMGLALAQRLGSRGHAVTVYERETQLGGLATYQDFGSFFWDRFYHVILPGDCNLIGFLRDIGLEDKLRWRQTRTGFYVDEQFHSMSSTMEFLRFKPVSLMGKIRMALTILYCARIRDWRRLEKLALEPWLRRLSGRATYEKIWKPLLLAKLGENYRRVSAVFIWTYVKRMYSARDTGAQREQLGYCAGGYRAIIERTVERIRAAGGAIREGVTVKHVAADAAAGVWVETDRGRSHYDKVVFTGPVNLLEQVAGRELVDCGRPGGSVEYLGVVCGVLVTRKPLAPYYIVNIADARIPFTGVIAMNNVVALEETAGRHLTYLPKYVHSEDPILRRPDEELRTLFLDGLRIMFPDLDDFGIESIHIHRAIKVQPLQVVNYSDLVPRVETRHPDFFVLNTSQFVANTLNNNEVIRAVDEFMRDHYPAMSAAPSPARAPAAVSV